MAAIGLQVLDNTGNSFLIGRSAEEPIQFIWVGTDELAFLDFAEQHFRQSDPYRLFGAGSGRG